MSTHTNTAPAKALTGRRVLLIAMACFGTVIAANMAMLFAATGSFPGLVVKNSYVASQGWNARTAAQAALGWQAEAAYADGLLTVQLSGEAGPVHGADVRVRLGRPASDTEDRVAVLAFSDGAYHAPADLGPGLWSAAITARHAGGTFEATARLFVAEDK